MQIKIVAAGLLNQGCRKNSQLPRLLRSNSAPANEYLGWVDSNSGFITDVRCESASQFWHVKCRFFFHNLVNNTSNTSKNTNNINTKHQVLTNDVKLQFIKYGIKHRSPSWCLEVFGSSGGINGSLRVAQLWWLETYHTSDAKKPNMPHPSDDSTSKAIPRFSRKWQPYLTAVDFHQNPVFLLAFFVFFQNVGSTILKPLKNILIWLKFHSGFSKCLTEVLKPTCSQFWVSMGSTLMLLSYTQHNQQLRITMTLELTSW